MKTVIYYFSATGNSLVVARDIARELGDCDVVPMTKATRDGGEVAYDRIGIVFPVYMFGLPLIVAEFVKMLQSKKNVYIFAVATYGGIPGRPITMIRKILVRCGLKLAAGFGVLMPGNYTPLYEAVAEDKQKAMFDKEAMKTREIATLVKKGCSGIFEEEKIVIGSLLHYALYRGGSSMIRTSAKDFWVTDKCIHCGTCEKVCPVENIKMMDGKPVWSNHCEHCMACLQWCPVAAIQYKDRTEGKKRYHHPAVKMADIAAQRQ